MAKAQAALPDGATAVQDARGGKVSALRQVLNRAEKGDKEALAKVRECFAASPNLLRQFGDLIGISQGNLIEHTASGNELMKEALTRRLEDVKRGLTLPNQSPLETLLVDRVALSWLWMGFTDGQEVQMIVNGGASFRQGEHCHRRAEQAERRFFAAVKALATLRRVPAPVVQLTLANQQVVANLTAPGST